MFDIAYAQAAPAAGQAAGSPAASIGAGLGSFFPFIIIMVLFYFLLIAPQNKERKKKEAMLAALKPGDRVLTVGGVYGTVAHVQKETDLLTLKIADNVKVEVSRAYIASVVNPEVEIVKK